MSAKVKSSQSSFPGPKIELALLATSASLSSRAWMFDLQLTAIKVRNEETMQDIDPRPRPRRGQGNSATIICKFVDLLSMGMKQG